MLAAAAAEAPAEEEESLSVSVYSVEPESASCWQSSASSMVEAKTAELQVV